MKDGRRRNHAKLFYDVGELSGLPLHAPDLESFLTRIVTVVAEHMDSEVCSIYLYASESRRLTLAANTGLHRDQVGDIELELGEGLTGVALKELRPICERHASKNPNFRYFPGLGEERFESFLAVPLHRGTRRIGVIVVQTGEVNHFSADDVDVLRAISSQVASSIELTNLMLAGTVHASHHAEPVDAVPQLIRGRTGAPGFAHAAAVRFDERVSFDDYRAQAGERSFGLPEFHNAVDTSERQLEAFQQEVEARLADVASLIFTAQILMLRDDAFLEAIEHEIEGGTNVIEAVAATTEEYERRFAALADPYLRERSQDVRDIGTRILENLIGDSSGNGGVEGRIVVAEELLPSDVLKLVSQRVAGVVLQSGGVTSHVCILAQSLQLPTVIAEHPALVSLPKDTMMLIDGSQGTLYIDPADDVLDSFRPHLSGIAGRLSSESDVPERSQTSDGTSVTVMANVNLLSDLDVAHDVRAEGIGLYRSEFPFVVRNDFPSEEEQYTIYRRLVEGMPKKEISIRTLDIGGDKVLSYFDHHLKEKNPYLGMRSIRFSLKHTEIFSEQIRAVVRAASGGNVRIMFPMISSVDEFLSAREIVHRCVADLNRERRASVRIPQIGMMVELPSVLEVIEELAALVDFFSIGTNDFVQYMLAVDRSNEKVADLYVPHHPSVIRALKKVIDAADRHGTDLSICGDMVHEAAYLPLLVGMGVRKVSANPTFLPRIIRTISSMELREATELADEVLAATRIADIERLLHIGANEERH